MLVLIPIGRKGATKGGEQERTCTRFVILFSHVRKMHLQLHSNAILFLAKLFGSNMEVLRDKKKRLHWGPPARRGLNFR